MENKIKKPSIGTIINTYVMYKEEEKELKDNLTEANTAIKNYFREHGTTEFKTKSGWTAKVTEVESVSYDNDGVLKMLEKKKLKDCIKTVKVIDWEKVKDKIIEQKITDKDLGVFENISRSEKLTIKQDKPLKEEKVNGKGKK